MTTFAVSDTTGWAALTSGSLPASGVTAGTYGDSTHVGQFTVNTEGIVTAASNVAVSGGGGTSGLVQLFDSTLGIAAASIDTGAGGIAAGHSALEVYITVQVSDAAVSANLNLTLNNDTGANYDEQYVFGNVAAVSAGAVSADTKWQFGVHATGGSANYASVIRITIPSYDQTTFWKSAFAYQNRPDATAANQVVQMTSLGYRSTTAISRMAIAGATGNLQAGTRLTVYGTQ